MDGTIKNSKRMIRIGITGPESSGKSTLALALSQYFKAPLIAEYAREFLEQSHGNYHFNDLDLIAREQWQRNEAEGSEQIRILDTEMLVMKVWGLFKFGKTTPYIQEAFQQQQVTLYLLCAPDFPWQADPLREHPEQQDALFALYHKELMNSAKPFLIMKGDESQRLNTAVKEILKLMGH